MLWDPIFHAIMANVLEGKPDLSSPLSHTDVLSILLTLALRQVYMFVRIKS